MHRGGVVQLGDRYPTTGTGRLFAAGLMIGGIALLGTVTATLASWLVEHVSASEERRTAELEATIYRLEAKLDQLTATTRTDQVDESTAGSKDRTGGN